MRKRSVLLPIFLIVVVDILGLTIVLPLLPFYAEHFGATPSVVGLLVTLYAACQLVGGPLLGRISDRMGRKPLLLLSQIGTLIGFLILGNARSLWMIFLSRFIDGITAGNLSLAQAYISDVTEPENRTKSFAIIGIAFGLGFLVGPAISGFLSQYGYRYPIWAASALSLTSIFATWFLLPNPKPVQNAEAGPAGKRLALLDWGVYAKYFRSHSLAPLLAQFFCFCFSFSLFVSGFALFAERRYLHHGMPYGPKQVGYLFAYSGFLGIILQGGLIGRMVKRWGDKRLVFAGFAAAIIGYSYLGFTYQLATLLIASTVLSFANGVLRPVLTSLISQSVSRSETGVVLGLTQSLNSIAQIVAPFFAGNLIQHHLLAPWALLAMFVSLLGIVIARSARSGA